MVYVVYLLYFFVFVVVMYDTLALDVGWSFVRRRSKFPPDKASFGPAASALASGGDWEEAIEVLKVYRHRDETFTFFRHFGFSFFSVHLHFDFFFRRTSETQTQHMCC